MLQYAAVTLVAVSGLLAGWIVARFSQEELDGGKRYFVLLKMSLMLIYTFFLLETNWSYVVIAAVLLGLVVSLYFWKWIIKPEFAYIYFGLTLPFNDLTYGSLMVFLHGLPQAAMIYDKRKVMVRSGVIFVMLSLGVYVLKTFLL